MPSENIPSRVPHSQDLSPWDLRRRTITSRAGGWRQGVDVIIRGHSLFHDLFGQISHMQLVILNATGRRVEPRVAQYFEVAFKSINWPDPRIWCNLVGALAGTVRTTVRAGTVVGALAAESLMYGGSKNVRASMTFIQESLLMYQGGDSIEHILSRCRHRRGRPIAPGYVRLMGGVDRRVALYTDTLLRLGIPVGPHRALALEISNYLNQHYNEGINSGGLDGAILSDLGFLPEDAYRIRSLANASGVTACMTDTRDRPGLAFLPLHCEDISYHGPDAQSLPSTTAPHPRPPLHKPLSPPDLRTWERRRTTITSRAGGWNMDDDVTIRGYSFFGYLGTEVSAMQQVILNATGRLVEPNVAEYFETMEICLSWPDPRIWCNLIGALAGTVRTTVAAGTMAGLLASDSHLYGGSMSSRKGMGFISKALEARRRGDSVERILSRCPNVEGRPIAPGYARPVGGKDERISPLTEKIKSLGFPLGPHRVLAIEISEYLEKHHHEGINVGGLDCAFLCDQGFSAEEIYRIRSTTTASGITACWTDTHDRPGQAFLPLQCKDIAYLGTSARTLPATAQSLT